MAVLSDMWAFGAFVWTFAAVGNAVRTGSWDTLDNVAATETRQNASLARKNLCGVKLLMLSFHNKDGKAGTVQVDVWSGLEVLRKSNKKNSCHKVYTVYCEKDLLLVTKTCDANYRSERGIDSFLGTRDTTTEEGETISMNADWTNLPDAITKVEFKTADIIDHTIKYEFYSRQSASQVSSGECGVPNFKTYIGLGARKGHVWNAYLDSQLNVEQDQYVQCASVDMDGSCPNSHHTEERCSALASGFDIQMGFRGPKEDNCIAQQSKLICCRRCECEDGRRSWPCRPVA